MKIEVAITMQPATNMIEVVNIETLPPGKPIPVKKRNVIRRMHHAAPPLARLPSDLNSRSEKSLKAKMRLKSLP